MYFLVVFILSTLVSAAPRPADGNEERNVYASVGSENEEDSLSRLKTFIRKQSPETALYTEEELKAYFNSDDSASQGVDPSDESQQGQEDGNSALDGDHDLTVNDSTTTPPGRPKNDLMAPVLESMRRRESSARERGNVILADESQNASSEEDLSDEEEIKPESKKKRITISIGAVRIPKKNARSGLSGQVNDQHDNSLDYPGQWSHRRRNGYFRGRTRSSSPSEESLAVLTQKLAKIEVEMGRLKEAVFLQGAVHIKTSERIEMMLLAQGKLAVKNEMDTRKLLKRVRRCCTCAKGGAKAQRALRRRRKNRNHRKPDEENTTPTANLSDSRQNMNNGYSHDEDSEAKLSNSQNNSRKNDRQSDSDSQRKGNALQSESIKTESSEESKDQNSAGSADSTTRTLPLPPKTFTSSHDESALNSGNSLPQQPSDSSGNVHDDQQNNDMNTGGLIAHVGGGDRDAEVQQHDDGKDGPDQSASSEILSTTTTVTTTPDDPRIPPVTTSTPYRAERTSQQIPPTTTTKTPSTLPAMSKKEPSTNENNVVREDVSKRQDGPTIFADNWQQATEASIPSKTNTVRGVESTTVSSLPDVDENHDNQLPVIRELKDEQNIDSVELKDDDALGKDSVEGQRQEQVAEKQQPPQPQSDRVLDWSATTSQQLHVLDGEEREEESTTVKSVVFTDGSSDSKHVDRNNPSTNRAEDSFRQPASDSDGNHAISTLPQQVHTDTAAAVPDGDISYHHEEATARSKEVTQTNNAYSPTQPNSFNAGMVENVTDKKSMQYAEKDDSYKHETSTKPSNAHYVRSTLSDTYSTLNSEESQPREQDQSRVQIPSENREQPPNDVIQTDQPSADSSIQKEESQTSDAANLLPPQEFSSLPSVPRQQNVNVDPGQSSDSTVTYNSEIPGMNKTQFSDKNGPNGQSSNNLPNSDQSETIHPVYQNKTKNPTSQSPSTSTASPSVSDPLSDQSSHRGDIISTAKTGDYAEDDLTPTDKKNLTGAVQTEQQSPPPETTTVAPRKSTVSSTTLLTTRITTSSTSTKSTTTTTASTTTLPTSTRRIWTTSTPSRTSADSSKPQDTTTTTKASSTTSSSTSSSSSPPKPTQPPQAIIEATAAATTTSKTGVILPIREATTATTTRMITETTLSTTTSTEAEVLELEVDLSTGKINKDNLPGVTWVVHPSSAQLSSSGRSLHRRWKKWKRSADAVRSRRARDKPCVIQGVLKFTFTPPTRGGRGRGSADGGGGGGGANEGERRRLLLDMEFDRPHRWVFNLGDSIANNGFSGDGIVQENDCEAQGYGKAFALYASDKHPNGRQKLLKLSNDYIHHKLTLVVADQFLAWDNHGRGGAGAMTDASLFALSGQSDRQGSVNYDVFLGLNRVIAGHYRRGHGLCRMSARWLKEDDD